MGTFFRWLMGPILVLFDRAEATRQMTLLRTLAVAVEKQFPLVPFLESLADEAGGRWRWKVRGLAELIAAGVSIPDALEAMPGILPRDVVALIRVGAQTGNMLGALREAATLARRRSDITGMQFQWTLLYLCLLIGALSTVATFVMVWIIPKYKAIFEGFEVKLPALTESVIRVSDFGAQHFYLTLLIPLAIGSLWLGLASALEAMGWSTGWAPILPFSPRLWPRYKAAQVLRSLSIAVDAGRPLADALSTLAARHPDNLLRLRAATLADDVARGGDCWQALQSLRMIAPGQAHLLEAAQRAGNLAWALRGMADGIERRGEYRFLLFIEFMHPVLVIGIGTVIGVFSLAMFLPLVELLNRLS